MKKVILCFVICLAMTTSQTSFAQTASLQIVKDTLTATGDRDIKVDVSLTGTRHCDVFYDKAHVKGDIVVVFKNTVGMYSDDRTAGILHLNVANGAPAECVSFGIIIENILEKGASAQPFAMRIAAVKTNRFSIQPNRLQTGGNLQIASPDALQKITWYDTKGSLVFAQTLDGSNTATVQVPVLSTGVYFIKINDESTQKIVVE
jgi:Secretion system C-terminal sorting domain